MSDIIALAGVICGSRGFMQYLIIRCRLKTQIALERERNQTHTECLNGFPCAAELLDYEDERGRSLWIRSHGQPGETALTMMDPSLIAGKYTHAATAGRQVKQES